MYLHDTSDVAGAPAVPAICPGLVSCAAPLILDGFGVGDYRIQAGHYERLMNLATGYRAGAGAGRVLCIEGHADNSGAELMNSGLSLNRALEVQRFLATIGVTGDMVVNAVGESRPIASNATPGGRSRNRRVELRLCRRPPPPPVWI